MTDTRTLGQIAYDASGCYGDAVAFSSCSPEHKASWEAAAQAVSAAVREQAFREGAEWMRERAAQSVLYVMAMIRDGGEPGMAYGMQSLADAIRALPLDKEPTQ